MKIQATEKAYLRLFKITSETIKNNRIGLIHNHAGSLSSNGIGLLESLSRAVNQRSIIDNNDPCHSLNLSVCKALDSLDLSHL